MAASRTSAALGTGCEGRDNIGRGETGLTREQSWLHLKDTRKLVLSRALPMCHQCEEKLLDLDRSRAAVGRLMLALLRNVSPFRPQEVYRRKRKRRSETDRTSRRSVSDRILAELESVPLSAVQQSEG